MPDEENLIQTELEQGMEQEYSVSMKKVRTKNLKKLIKLDFLEKERIAAHIKSLYDEEKAKHFEKCNKIDEADDVYRMRPKSLQNDDGDSPTYRSPLTTVTLEVVHANIMNVFFTPAKIMRALPTEEGDISKIEKLDLFGNWSIQNELEIFENCDRMFHASEKGGESPYIVHWVKEYGTEIKKEIIPNPLNPSEPLLDEDGEVMVQEREERKLLYDGPKLEVFSRKDYILPSSATMDTKPDWEMRIVRRNADKVKRSEEEGRYFQNVFESIGGWGGSSEVGGEENQKKDKDGNEIPLGKTEKLFIEFYGSLRIKQITKDENDEESYEELEEEFIGLVELVSETLCFLKKNKFPLKERPIGMDVFIPDDEGRREGTGIVEFMSGVQNCYDTLYNQYIFGITQSNNPFGFFAPTGNMRDEPLKIKAGFLFPSSDPNSVNMVKIAPPDRSMLEIMEIVNAQAQVLFGVSDYSAGVESKIDPSAPARKAELVVQQGNTRMNLIVRRKNRTLKDIFRRWYLLYKENMPKNKFVRIAGESKENPFRFESISMTDFALNSIPDFELTGNILNSNKTLEAQKAFAIYDKLSQNFFFLPQTVQGMQALRSLTGWLIDKMDEIGLSNFLPSVQGVSIHTPEEENALFIQGDLIEPEQGEDHIYHLRIHSPMLQDMSLLPEIIDAVKEHIQKTIDLLKQMSAMQAMGGGMNAQPAGLPGMPGGAVQPQRVGVS